MSKFLRSVLCSLLAFSVTIGLTACAPIIPPGTVDPPQVDPPPTETVAVQTLDYTESTAALSNPDQGFYIPLSVTVKADGITYDPNVIGTTKLYHLRMDISAYSANAGGTDRPLSKAALDGIASLLDLLREHDKNAIVRFCYAPGFGKDANCEPSLENMVGHAKQFLAVLETHPATVTAVEVGMVGPWGEMHTSEIVKDPATINTLIDAFLDNTSTLPVLVRTPKMIYNYLKVPDHLAITRLGLFNDGYLGSETDLGTYEDRETDVAFISGQTAHLPFGGEVTVPDSTLHNIETCLPEMNKIHLSYLNAEWDNRVIEKWKNTFYTQACGLERQYYGKTAFTYIQNRLGYRFVLKNSVFTYSSSSEKLNVRLTLQNAGFGNLNRNKRAKLIFTDSTGATAFIADYGEIALKDELEFNVEHGLESGKYDVYLRIYGEELQSAPLYCVKFANDGLWNNDLKANKIGSFELISA